MVVPSEQYDLDSIDTGDRVLVPDVIPIFPLPGTVLLPGELLPLHIFEPRYRDLVRDALEIDRLIGIVAIAPGHDRDHLGNPPVEKVGCLGLIGDHSQTEDGRYLIWLAGAERFRIEEELQVGTRYRQARVTYAERAETPDRLAGLQPLRQELVTILPGLLPAEADVQQAMSRQLEGVTDSQLLALASTVLQLGHERKQKLLESDSVVESYKMIYEDLYANLGDHPSLTEIDPEKLN